MFENLMDFRGDPTLLDQRIFLADLIGVDVSRIMAANMDPENCSAVVLVLDNEDYTLKEVNVEWSDLNL